jgi:hypothetical protein
MKTLKNEELLADPRVKDEIGRHRWIESEKAGKDIGFEKASAEWLNNYSEAWVKEYLTKTRVTGRSAKRV